MDRQLSTDKLTTGLGSHRLGWPRSAIGTCIGRWGLLALGRSSLLNSWGVQFVHFSGGAALEGGGDQAEHHERTSEGPRAFFKEIGRPLYSADLLRSGETSSEAAAFGVLCKNNEGQKGADDENDDGDGDHGYLFN